MSPRKSLPTLLDTGAKLVRQWYSIEESKTEVLRDLAVVVVDIRSRFDHEGSKDWAGHSWDYRQAISGMYEAAGVPPDSVANVQGALRYHVGNVLRDRVSPEELEAAGLKVSSPRQRVASARSETAALVAAVTAERDAEAAEGRGRRYPVGRLLSAAKVAVERAEKDLTADEDAGTAEDMEAALLAAMDLRERLDAIVERLRGAYARRSGQEDPAPS